MSRNFIDEFNNSQNKSTWDGFYKYIANMLSLNNIPLENVFFVNTPAFIVYLSEYDKSIIQRPASYYSDFVTRRVMVEKYNFKKKKIFECFFDRKTCPEDKIITKPLSVINYRLNWNESLYGIEYSTMKSLKKFIKSKSHLALFLYVDTDFFDKVISTKIIRVATLDLDI